VRNGSGTAPESYVLPVNVWNGNTSSAEEVALAQLDRVDAELERGVVDERSRSAVASGRPAPR
jgi:hypothetical protein